MYHAYLARTVPVIVTMYDVLKYMYVACTCTIHLFSSFSFSDGLLSFEIQVEHMKRIHWKMLPNIQIVLISQLVTVTVVFIFLIAQPLKHITKFQDKLFKLKRNERIIFIDQRVTSYKFSLWKLIFFQKGYLFPVKANFSITQKEANVLLNVIFFYL